MEKKNLYLYKDFFFFFRKKYGSDMSIIGGIAAPGNSQVSRLCSHRSDHEIHTPQHRADQVE